MELPSGYDMDTVVRLETNLDDLSSEISGAVMERLFAAGALDVWFTPVHMKKNRPGVMLSVLCDEDKVPALAELALTETTAFGLRIERITRLKLQRRFETVHTDFGDITIKLGMRSGVVVQASPEFESCKKASEVSRVPLRTVYEATIRAWQQSR